MSRGDSRITLKQHTSYPYRPLSEIEVATDKPGAFTVYLRIPAWAGPKTMVSVNDRKFDADLMPGKFLAVNRTWKNGDRLAINFDMTTSLEPVDPQHPNIVAPIYGPLTMFAIGQPPASGLRRSDLYAAVANSTGSGTGTGGANASELTLKPFASIEDELYRLYHTVES